MERLTPFADTAAGLAEAGWLVFPLKTRGKVPLIPKEMGGRGHKDGTTDPAQVARWVRAYPRANIGTRVPQSLIVVDVDPRNGGDGTVGGWEAEHGPIPETLTVWSGRGDGGRHLYFLAPAFKPSRDRLKGAGVDLKDHGGYVVLPPSIHPEGEQRPYRWGEPTCAPVRLPAWLADLLRPPRHKTRSVGNWQPFRVARQEATQAQPGDRLAAKEGAQRNGVCPREHTPFPRGLPSVEFDRTATWADVLEPAGWSHVKEGRWRRPGKDEGTSAEIVTAKDGTELLHVFSSNAGPFLPDRNYSKFAAWAELAHRGSWKAAAASLREGRR